MTSVDGGQSPLRVDLGVALRGRSKAELLEHAAMLALVAFWAVPFTRAAGGRGVHNLLLFAALLLVVLPAMQVWRAPSLSVLLAVGVGLAAVLVCVFAPAHWYGSDVAAGYVIAAAVYVAARRYVRDAERRTLVCACICLASLYQFEQAFLPWWGSASAKTSMAGTFYWHNPYAAFMLPGAVLGLGLIVLRRSPWNLVGWLSVPICTAGVVFSSSRATIAALLVAWTLVAAFGIRDRQTAVRVLGATAVTIGVVLALPGPPLFDHYAAPWSAAQARSESGETLSQNGEFRLQFWREALEVAAHRPVVGTGFHELANASAMYTSRTWARSPLAHNGYLQPLSDGGLLLGVPFLAAVAVVLWWALRGLWRFRPTRAGPKDFLELCAVLTMLAVFAHSAVDFDWSHPAILVQVALLAAVVAPVLPPRNVSKVAVASLLVLGATLGLLLPALHQWQQSQLNRKYSTDQALDRAGSTFGYYRLAQLVLSDYVHGDRPLSPAQVARGLSLTSSQAAVDLHIALLRDAAGALAGLNPDAVAQARARLERYGGLSPAYVPDLALVMISAGQGAAARDLLSSDIAAQARTGKATPSLAAELEQWAKAFGPGRRYACAFAQAKPLLADGVVSQLPQPTASCIRHDQGHG